ncbi:MAG: glycosyltransferase family 2 protein [Chloroflexota bacterium]|nr:MAG: glycosyltransferase family 2 protein [Chloroflexota bacterium]
MQNGDQVELSLVIPAYNAARMIVGSLRRARAYLKDRWSYEIIVVDDGSADRTVGTITRLQAEDPTLRLLCNGKNRGKGYAVTRGMLEARGRYILCTDADMVYPLDLIETFIDKLNEGYDVAVGSRVVEGSLYAMHPRHFPYIYQRHLVGRVFIWVVHRVLDLPITDTQCGFKLFRREAAQAIFPRVELSSFAFDVEVLLIGRRLDYRIAEMPVYYRYDGEGSSVQLFRDSLKMFTDLLIIRKNDARRRYGPDRASSRPEQQASSRHL